MLLSHLGHLLLESKKLIFILHTLLEYLMPKTQPLGLQV